MKPIYSDTKSEQGKDYLERAESTCGADEMFYVIWGRVVYTYLTKPSNCTFKVY